MILENNCMKIVKVTHIVRGGPLELWGGCKSKNYSDFFKKERWGSYNKRGSVDILIISIYLCTLRIISRIFGLH